MNLLNALDLNDGVAAIATLAASTLSLGAGFVWGRRHERHHGILSYAPDSEFTPPEAATGKDIRRSKRQEAALPAPAPARVTPPAPAAALALPRQWLIADSTNAPLMRIEAVEAARYGDRVRRSALPAKGSVTQLAAMLQAVPTVLSGITTHAAAQGGQLMRVEISGALTRAADGNGLRAIALDANGKISENARLFSADKVQRVVNVAAVFQVISVLVAQKHLADINARLVELHAAIQGIAQFQDNARRARVNATYNYLQQAHATLAQGELSAAIRAQLESCERDLLTVHLHLMEEYRQTATQPIQDTDTFGTEGLKKSADAKIARIAALGQELMLCLRTRMLAWHVLSLYPGEPGLKEARAQQIREALAELVGLPEAAQAGIRHDLTLFKSLFTRNDALQERKNAVQMAARQSHEQFNAAHQRLAGEMESAQQLLLKHDRPRQYVFELQEGRIVGMLLPQ